MSVAAARVCVLCVCGHCVSDDWRMSCRSAPAFAWKSSEEVFTPDASLGSEASVAVVMAARKTSARLLGAAAAALKWAGSRAGVQATRTKRAAAMRRARESMAG